MPPKNTKRRYAEDTSVPVSRSQQHVRDMLKRIDADMFMFGDDSERILIAFRAQGRQVKIELPKPDDTPQGERMIWRQLLLLVTARVTEIQNEISDFDTAFMPHIMLSDGRVLGERARMAIHESYTTGQIPALLPGKEA